MAAILGSYPWVSEASNIAVKPKLAAVLIISIMILSIVATGVAAISQAGAEDSGLPGPGQAQALTGLADEPDAVGGDNSMLGALKFICPFH